METLETLKNIQYTKKLDAEALLTASDYKVIKNAEAFLLGIELPYDSEKLHTERQVWRDTINSCEDEIEKLNNISNDEELNSLLD